MFIINGDFVHHLLMTFMQRLCSVLPIKDLTEPGTWSKKSRHWGRLRERGLCLFVLTLPLHARFLETEIVSP